MEIENVRCLEVAAQLALINMLKVNLSCCPDIYRTLLAILCDFDPDESDSKEKTCQYIRLLISDKMLANCIIVSLPQGKQEWSELKQRSSSLPSKHNTLPYKNNSSSGKRIWLSQLSPEAKEISEAPDKSITIIVSGQDYLEDTTGLSEDKTLSILSIPHPVNVQPKEFPAKHVHVQALNDKPPKVVKMVASPVSSSSGQRHTLSENSSCTSKKPCIEKNKISLSVSCSSNQLVATAMSGIVEYKQKDSVKAVRSELLFPVQDTSQGLVSIPSGSSSSQSNINFSYQDIMTSVGQQQIYVNTYSPDYQETPDYTAMAQSDSATPCLTYKTKSQTHTVRKYINTCENKIMKGIPTSSSTFSKVSTEAKRSASFGEEPVSKVRKVTESVAKQVFKSNVDSGASSMQCFQPRLDISYSIGFPTNIDKLGNIQNDSTGYDDIVSCLATHSNSVSGSTAVNNSKETKYNVNSSMQEREITLKSLPHTQTYTNKSLSQHSLLTPSSKDQMSTCRLTKQYHLSYPNISRIAPEFMKELSQTCRESNQSGTESVLSYSCSSHSNMLEHPKYSTSVSNTLSCGSTGPRSFPYRQQFHLSDGSMPVLDFPIDFLVNDPTVSRDSKRNLEMCHQEGKRKNKPFEDRKEADENITHQTGLLLNNSSNKKDSHLLSYEEKDQPKPSAVLNEGDTRASNNNNSVKQTFLIIETKTSNGSDQVQIKLNPGTSGNLLGELLKLKPGLVIKQGSSEPNITDYFTNELETILTSNSETKVAKEQVQSIDSLLTLDDKNTLSDISDVASSNSEEFQCSDDQYEFSDQSDIYPMQMDVYAGEPKFVSLPTLNTTAFQQTRDQSSDRVQSLTSRSYLEPYTSMHSQMLPFSSSISAGLTDRFDPINSVHTGSGDNGNLSRFSSCGMSPYLFGMIPDMNSSAYDDNLSLEGSDDVLLNDYISPNSVRFRPSNIENGSTSHG